MTNRKEKVETVTDFTFLGSKITADSDRSHEIKSRGIALLTKACIVKVMIFPVVVYRCQSWIIKKGEHKRIDAFKLCCYRRLFRVLWTGRRSNQSILRKSSLNIDWKNWYWSSNSLATWCKEPIHWQKPWYWEGLEGQKEKGLAKDMIKTASLTQWTWICANSKCCSHGVAKSWTWLSDWTTATTC